MPETLTENDDNPRALDILNVDTSTAINGVKLKITFETDGRITISLQAE